MSTVVGLQESVPLNQEVWQAWVAKGRARDQRGSAARLRAVKWISIMGLFVAAALWSHLASYEIVIRIIVTAGALVMMFQAFQARQRLSAAVFAALVLLHNPLVPMFSFSGDWQRALMVVSILPLLASLSWGYANPVQQ